MTRKSLRLLATLVLAGIVSPAIGSVANAQGQGQQISICHRTGSATNPWVFVTVDVSTWPEHQAQGDFQASSLADCTAAAQRETAPAAQPPAPAVPAAQPQPVPAAPAVQPAPAAPAAQPQPAAPAAPAAGGQAQPGAAPGDAAVAALTRPAPVEAAGAQAPSAPEPSVSSLPPSGGEPDRNVLVLGLLALGALGLGMRRLSRARA